MGHDVWLREDGPVAGKRTAELNAGEPRTVRMIYFLPNDRPYRQSVVDTMKARMVRLQAWFWAADGIARLWVHDVPL